MINQSKSNIAYIHVSDLTLHQYLGNMNWCFKYILFSW